MIYDKKDATMTRGIAILSMVLLHLFCNKGEDMMYQPLIWLTPEKPLAYWFGFFGEICVPLYSICAGYAGYLMLEKGKAGIKDNGRRAFKLLRNYWIILILFSLLGLLSGHTDSIPTGWREFFESIVLLHSYNGAWWCLKTYLIILLIPSFIVLFPVKKIHSYLGMGISMVLFFVWYLTDRAGILNLDFGNSVFNFIGKEAANLFHVLPLYWFGAFAKKGDIFNKANSFLRKIRKQGIINALLLVLTAITFVAANVLEKGILMAPVAVEVWLAFNLIKKPAWLEKCFLFLGKHSTNTWLTHMFFYGAAFGGFVWKARYAGLVFVFLMVLCIASSYVEILMEKGIDRLFGIIRKKSVKAGGNI